MQYHDRIQQLPRQNKAAAETLTGAGFGCAAEAGDGVLAAAAGEL